MNGENDMEYKTMLLDLAKSLTDSELEQMKFLCKDLIKKRDRETIKTATDLWEHLETREKVGPQNLAYLKDLLRKCCDGRVDVIKIVENYESGGYHRDAATSVQGHGVQFHQMPVPVQQPQVAHVRAYQRNPQTSTHIDTLRNEVNFLTRSLGKEWRFFMRTLGLTDSDMSSIEQDHPRNLRDQIYECMSQVITDRQGTLTKHEIIAALRDSSVERCDLAARIEDGDI